ncbi:MAG TPA: cupin domain-containing protein [Thermoplasmata archaeon]|jgi:quercetin dioxygenase-like cupin family protein
MDARRYLPECDERYVEHFSYRIRDKPPPEWMALSSGIHARVMVEGNGSSITLYRLEPGRRFERHIHPFPELGVVLVGRGVALIGDEKRTLREGDSFYFPSGTPHGFEVDAEEPAVLMNVTVPLSSDVAGPPASEVLRSAKQAIRRDHDTSEAPG